MNKFIVKFNWLIIQTINLLHPLTWTRSFLMMWCTPLFTVTFYTKSGHKIPVKGFSSFKYTKTSEKYTSINWILPMRLLWLRVGFYWNA